MHSSPPTGLLGSETVAAVKTDCLDIHNWSHYSGQSVGALEVVVQVEVEEGRNQGGRKSVIEMLLAREGFRKCCASLTARKMSALEEAT